MTIVDIYKPNKQYKSVTVYKRKYHMVTDVYLYMQVIRSDDNKICIKYLVLNNLLNYLPTKPIVINDEYTKILNMVTVKANNFINLNIIVVDKLINPSIFEYKFNFTFISIANEYIKQFFNLNDLRYKICNVTHKIQNINTKKIEEELLCNLFNNFNL